jgi:cytochrome P450
VGPPRRLRRGRAALHGLVDRTIAERRATGEDRGDLLSALVLGAASDRVTHDAVRDHAVTLLLAGHETTANALAFACHLLATAPDVDAAVHEEVARVLAVDDLDPLPRCRALFAEALRLFPPSWAMGRELREDLDLGGTTIPAGDLLVLSQWVVHRDPRWWPEPARCRLERWTDAAATNRPRGAYFPFGAGVRQCIGEGFAWTEGVLAIATVVRRWRFLTVPERDLTLEPLITLRPRDGCWLQPVPRLP